MIGCPLCNKDDQIQKVSSIISSGSSSGSYAGPAMNVNVHDGKVGYGGSFITGNIHSSSHLAQKLAAPIPPAKPRTPAKVYIGWFLAIGFGACTLSTFFGAEPEGIWFVIICLITGVFLIYQGNKEKLKITSEYNEKFPVWEKEMEVWNKLYYCYRDDVMFNPENGDYWTWKYGN